MYEIFKTVVVMSICGAVMTFILLWLKPLTAKRLPAKWQYYICVAGLLVFILPLYRLIPTGSIQEMKEQEQVAQQSVDTVETTEEPVIIEQTPFEYREIEIGRAHSVRITELVMYVWLAGAAVFLLVVTSSYAVYLRRRKKNAVELEGMTAFDRTKQEIGVKRRIRIRISGDISSPMLVGVFLPVVYIPCKQLPEENMRMVFLHELTHCKHHDLLIKWLAVLVNAIHWFNPFIYLLCANISEACEVSCDMAAVKDMNEEEQKLYMKTILELAE